MGEFEDGSFGREDAADARQAASAGASPDRARERQPGTDPNGDVSPRWRVRARRELSQEYVLEEVEPGSREAARVLALHESMKARARLYADHLEQLAVFFREDPEVQGLLDDADVTALKVATGLRCTYVEAHAQVRDAHLAVEWMPHMFEHLRAGDLPEAWHHWLLRQVRRLDEAQVREVDADMAGVEIASVSKATFDTHVRLAVARASADTPPTPPSTARDARIVDIDSETGTASLCVTGPIPEIRALAHRLDIAARTVQKAQRAGLEDDAEGPLPFDIDEDLRDRGRPLSLRALRYAIVTHSILDIDPVEETRSPYKILVTVPVTTLLGIDKSPAMLDGLTPIPAEQARALAGGEKTWQRILTDPIAGAHLPVSAETYHPTAQMRLQLRLRHPVCAVPGCTRTTVLAAEDDHIIEYDHTHPGTGGRTSLWNLHRLCWLHHTQKTAGLIDPDRDPTDDPATGDHSTTGPLETTWTLGATIRTRTREHTDLLTPHTTRALEHAWQTHQHAHGDAAAEPPPNTPDRDTRRTTPPDPIPDETDPPF